MIYQPSIRTLVRCLALAPCQQTHRPCILARSSCLFILQHSPSLPSLPSLPDSRDYNAWEVWVNIDLFFATISLPATCVQLSKGSKKIFPNFLCLQNSSSFRISQDFHETRRCGQPSNGLSQVETNGPAIALTNNVIGLSRPCPEFNRRAQAARYAARLSALFPWSIVMAHRFRSS